MGLVLNGLPCERRGMDFEKSLPCIGIGLFTINSSRRATAITWSAWNAILPPRRVQSDSLETATVWIIVIPLTERREKTRRYDKWASNGAKVRTYESVDHTSVVLLLAQFKFMKPFLQTCGSSCKNFTNTFKWSISPDKWMFHNDSHNAKRPTGFDSLHSWSSEEIVVLQTDLHFAYCTLGA